MRRRDIFALVGGATAVWPIAAALGIDVPLSLLIRADELIE